MPLQLSSPPRPKPPGGRTPSLAAAEGDDQLGDLLSPHISGLGRRKRRQTAMMKRRASSRRDSLFDASGELLAPLPELYADAPSPQPSAGAPSPSAHALGSGGQAMLAPPDLAGPPGASGSAGLLRDIMNFDKGGRLKNVRRQSRAFANGGSPSTALRRSISGGSRKSVGGLLPPPPPPVSCGEAVATEDIASVLARAIMRRRTESRLREDDSDDEHGAVPWGVSP